MIEFFLYLVSFLNNLDSALVLMMFVIAICAMGSFIFYRSECINKDEAYLKQVMKESYLVPLIKTFLILLIINIFIPSQSTLYMIMGAHYLKQSNLPSKVETVLNEKLDQYISEYAANKK